MSESMRELCSWDVGGDPAAGCDNWSTTTDGLCYKHQAAYEALCRTGAGE